MMPARFNNSFFNDLWEAAGLTQGKRTFSTPLGTMKTDIRELEKGYELKIDLPGYPKENISAELKDGYLTVSASTQTESDSKEENGKYLHRERYFGSCSRSFYVGEDLSLEDIKARFEDGILTIGIPKKEALPEKEEQTKITIE